MYYQSLGSGPVGLRCVLWEHEVAGSNPVYPTIKDVLQQLFNLIEMNNKGVYNSIKTHLYSGVRHSWRGETVCNTVAYG